MLATFQRLPGTERANAVTHALGLLLALAATPWLLRRAVAQGTTWHLVGAGAYALTLLVVYAASTAYHLAAPGPGKDRLQMLDHIAIFGLIAGSYTPFLLLNLHADGGPVILALVWLVALGGMIWKAVCTRCAPGFSTGLYIILGWAMLLVIGRLDAAMPEGGLRWLLAGGSAYSLGVVFYLWFRLPYHHAVWHGFVLLGSACHTVAIADYSLVCRI